jgi:hypothetical protein
MSLFSPHSVFVRHVRISISVLFLLTPLLAATSTASEPPPQKIIAVDRNRIQVESGEWLELAGINMINLSSKKKSPSAFSLEVNDFLKTYVGKKVMIEEESNPRIGARGKTVYVYYLVPTSGMSVQSKRGAAVKPVLLIDRISGQDGKLKANMTPHLKVMINAELIGKGYARVSSHDNFKHKKEFLLAEKEAQLDEVGIWE